MNFILQQEALAVLGVVLLISGLITGLRLMAGYARRHGSRHPGRKANAGRRSPDTGAQPHP